MEDSRLLLTNVCVSQRILAFLFRGTLPPPLLLAVSKTKPLPLLQAAYDAGQRHFGENYAAEIIDKCVSMPSDVKWHMIGHLQSNKVKPLIKAAGR